MSQVFTFEQQPIKTYSALLTPSTSTIHTKLPLMFTPQLTLKLHHVSVNEIELAQFLSGLPGQFITYALVDISAPSSACCSTKSLTLFITSTDTLTSLTPKLPTSFSTFS